MDTKSDQQEQELDMDQARETKPRRIIKRYSNRKLYDTKGSRYVTLLQISELVRQGEEIQVVDNVSKQDLTEVTLAQILFEEQKQKERSLPLQTLKDLLARRTETVLSQLREGPIGRLLPHPSPPQSGQNGHGLPLEPGDLKDAVAQGATEGKTAKSEIKADRGDMRPTGRPSLVDQAKEKLGDMQHQIDERVRAVVPTLFPWAQHERDLRKMEARMAEIEKQLSWALELLASHEERTKENNK